MKLNTTTTQILKKQALDLYNQINVLECFGTSDLVRYEAICQELERRGYEILEENNLCII